VASFKPDYLVRGLPGHPLHPPLTDVTIGAYSFATIAGFLSVVGVAEHGFAQAWWLALVVALASSVLTAATGLVDWLGITWGSELWKTATMHMTANLAATVCFGVAAIVGHDGYTRGAVTTGAFVLTVAGFVLLTVGGWLGGTITFVHGMRVLELPEEPSLRAAAPVATKEKVEAAEG
jgi:uncharacterized membrane protein